jgi:ArsR family transcriptional regulator
MQIIDSKDCTQKFKVLSDNLRVKILQTIANQELCVSVINETIKISQNLLSYHLRILEENKLIHGTRKGKNIYYKCSDLVEFSKSELVVNYNCCQIKFH